jgi:diguanylate cyclase (GGDEF)-like protein
MSSEHAPRAARLQKGSEVTQQIAKQKRTNDRLKYLSRYDELTTLPNRAFLRKKLEKALKVAREAGHTVAVLFLSLDPYSRINETLGPAMGDRLVRCVAKRLKDAIGENDAVGYWGSDKFVLLLECSGDASLVIKSVESIKKRIERSFYSFKQEFFLTTSIGIGLYPLHGSTVETLLKNAGAALFEAKGCGGNSSRFYTADLNVRALKRFALENSLSRGLQRRQFNLHYQAQVHSGSRQITGAEALIRWEHPELGPISPAEFIPLAEKSGLIIPIGEWVMRAACSQLKKWHANGFPKLSLAINVSARQFQEAAPADMIVKILDETRLDPECLELELTESALMANADHVIQSLRKLKDKGVKLAIDDFGTGFSSFEYLRRLPLDILKIDQSFVRDASNRDGAALLSSIIDLAHKLQLRVVAEGVETEEQLIFLQRLGCDHMQGYLFSRPVAGEQFQQMLTGEDFRLNEPNGFIYARAV